METKTGRTGIGRYAHLYKISRSWAAVGVYVRTLHSLFYKKIAVEGKENIPADCPLIFAPNHQNALMDPLAVLFTARKQTVFLARADIFNNKILAKIFYFLKILPVFRMRDGRENLQHNDETFDIAVRVLESGQSVGLFPETRHNNKRSLLPLKKGVQRLAFMAEEKNDFTLNVKVVPVGINYSNYAEMRATLFVKYGAPISVADYKDEYLENPQKAMISLRDELESRIKPLMIDIADNEMYDTADSIRNLCSENESDCAKKFQIQQEAIEKFASLQAGNPEKAQILKEKVAKFE
ncbi:MAG: 1-acyl-sn-glycerol-3-phosphate acyltransferase, partial [Prevotellaceae bacterium]|nr:1-acyl-sn-glycerol-3-phosphate acyltransferase [Prevotellaceae bacterium]